MIEGFRMLELDGQARPRPGGNGNHDAEGPSEPSVESAAATPVEMRVDLCKLSALAMALDFANG